MIPIVFVRHGKSIWNVTDRFTGWVDIDLHEEGIEQAHQAARLLQEGGYTFDIAHTSVLRRAIRTLWVILDDLDLMWIPEYKTWRLNERHYGALQGLNKVSTLREFGEKQFMLWRRSFDVPPPPLSDEDNRRMGYDRRYGDVPEGEVPRTECLKDTMARVLPYWHETIVPQLKEGKRLIISAHGNSLRALVKYLDNVSDEEIVGLNIPTGIPLVYELDENLRPLRHFYLGDPEEARRAAEAVAAQGRT